MSARLEVVFFDVGGPLYDHRPYWEAILAAIEERRPHVDRDAYWRRLDGCRRDQRGPFTTRMVAPFLPQGGIEEVIERGRGRWRYPPGSLHGDVVPTLETLAGSYRLGILANQESRVREAMARDGIDRFFDLWTISAEVGAEKPRAAIFQHALEAAGVAARRCAMVGDRLDNDVAPARDHGMRTVWILRGEAPDDPRPHQLGLADAVIPSLTELPETLAALPEPSA